MLKNHYGLILPEKMREEVGYAVKGVSDREHKELSPEWIYSIFEARYLRYQDLFTIVDCHFTQKEGITAEIIIRSDGKETTVTAAGNGRIDAVSNAIKQYFQLSYELAVYEEHALTRGSSSKAVAYIGVCRGGKTDWGVGIDEDIVRASIHALVVAVNHCLFCAGKGQDADIRLREILEFIQTNYRTVTLEELARRFYLSVPYLSKYIKEKSGKTFCDTVSEIRMQRACTLLRGETISVEKVAEKVGYPSVEHFNRQFKKRYGSTPLEYRNQR